MRAATKGFLRYPLNEILRSEGAVRVLRALSRHGGTLAPQTIARQAGLSNPAVNRLLKTLTNTGVVVTVGQGRYPAYQIDATHPLAAQIGALFAVEDARVTTVLDAVRAATLPHAPIAVWWYGSSARDEDAPGSDVDVAVFLPEAAPEAAVAEIREALQPTESAERVAVSVVAVWSDDVRRLAAGDPWWTDIARDAVPLHGPTPEMAARGLGAERPAPVVRRAAGRGTAPARTPAAENRGRRA